MAEADALREWALSSPVVPIEAATADQLGRHLEFMAAALPSRANDADTGRKRAAVYATILAGRSNAALAYMARTACETLDWFPSPKQCLAILADYRDPMTEQAATLIGCDHFSHHAFEQWIAALARGGAVGDVPDRWMRIAVERGYMRRLADGSYVSRALYQGPPPPPFQPALAGGAAS